MKRLAFAAVVTLLVAGASRADRVVVIRSSKARVDSVYLSRTDLRDGGLEVAYTICGHAEYADGGPTQQTCPMGVYQGDEAVKLMHGKARQIWVKHERLE